MQKGVFFCLWILFTFSLFAQNKENGSVTCDSIVHKNTFVKALKKFLDFSDFDTTYISPNRYNYALMLDHFTNYEYYSVGNDGQRLRFSTLLRAPTNNRNCSCKTITPPPLSTQSMKNKI